MKIVKVVVSNFRILKNVTVELDDLVTLVVGRNNSGKTSLAEVFNNFFSGGEKSKFRFDDFTLCTFDDFKTAKTLYDAYAQSVANSEDEKIILSNEIKYKSAIPKIVAEIHLNYEDKDDGKLASLSNFLMDLDKDRKDALISCEYGIFEPEKVFKTFTAYKINSTMQLSQAQPTGIWL